MHDEASLQACAHYARELRDDLPADSFQRNPARLWWLPAHLALIGGAAYTLLALDIHWGLRLLLSVAIGHSYGCLMYLAHEILHGSVVKSARLQNLLSG